MNGNWNYPTQVKFGPGRIKEIAECCVNAHIRRPLIVTDSGLAELPMIRNIEHLCASQGLQVAVFSDVGGNPAGHHVENGVTAALEHESDGVIAVGGGSAIDVGKAVALMMEQGISLWDLEDIGDNYTRANASAIKPTIAVPTTAGTGSEVGRSSVIVHEQEQRKVIVFHPMMMPGLVIADPELTLSLPAGLTAATGMDALSHNLEALCARGDHPMADGIAVEGIRLIHRSLETAVSDGRHLQARADMLIGSMMGATAFQKGLGAMHAMAHPIGAQLKAHHGLINAIVMPYVLMWNAQAIDERITRLATYIGLENSGFDGFMDWILNLRKTIEIPHTLAALGMEHEQIDALAAMAAVDPAGGGNPVTMTVDDYRSLFDRALRGDLSG